VVYNLFFTGPRARGISMDEVPFTMYAPTALCAIGTIFFGIFATVLLPSINATANFLLAR
jgi:hypothetical protein